MTPASRQEDVQALHRRRVPAQRVGPHVRGGRTERRARLAQGRARRGAGGAQRRSRAGRTRPRTTAARCSTASPRWWRRARPSSPSSAAAATKSSARSIASSGTPAGPTSCRRCSAARTRSPARTSTSRSPSRPASSPCSRRTSRRCSASSRGSMPPLVGGNAVVAVASETHPLAAIELAEAIATSDVPGGVVNILTGSAPSMAPMLASHMDVNAIDLCGADGYVDRARGARGRERQARRPRPRRRAEPVGDLELPRAEDRLAPDRPVGPRLGRGMAERSFSHAIAEGDGISVIAAVEDADAARAAE